MLLAVAGAEWSAAWLLGSIQVKQAIPDPSIPVLHHILIDPFTFPFTSLQQGLINDILLINLFEIIIPVDLFLKLLNVQYRLTVGQWVVWWWLRLVEMFAGGGGGDEGWWCVYWLEVLYATDYVGLLLLVAVWTGVAGFCAGGWSLLESVLVLSQSPHFHQVLLALELVTEPLSDP